MAEFLVWRKEWLIDISPMDEDHRELVRLLNLLANHGSQALNPLSKETFLHHFDNFTTLINEHFIREEAFMLSIKFPQFLKHKRDHTVQKAAFIAFRQHLVSSGLNNFEPADLNWIKMWFLDHVFAEDQEYADFYHGQKQ